jgi:hypothetical protein
VLEKIKRGQQRLVAEGGLSQDEMEHDLATKEMLRKNAAECVLASGGKLPHLPTNEEIEGR